MAVNKIPAEAGIVWMQVLLEKNSCRELWAKATAMDAALGLKGD
jgi:hypothetical protein